MDERDARVEVGSQPIHEWEGKAYRPERLLQPEDIAAKAGDRGLTGWKELAAFYRRYLQVLGAEG